MCACVCVKRAGRTVDAPDVLVHVVAQLLVARDLRARRDRNLQQHDLARPRGVSAQERLDRFELVRDALDIVEPVDAEQHLSGVGVG